MVDLSGSLDFIRPPQNHHLIAKASLFVFIVFEAYSQSPGYVFTSSK